MSSRRAWPWIGLAVVTIALVLDLLHHPQHVGIDFHTYLAAATVGLQQGWSHVYDQSLVAAAQRQLVPGEWAQPFLSPPTVAWMAAPLTMFPYWTAFGVWAAAGFLALGAAVTWAGVSSGTGRWIAVIGAVTPWWVLHAVNLGQVVPFVAFGVVVAWRLVRDDKEVAAGVLLSVIFLKPNTAILVPVVLLAAGRYRVFAAWLAAGAVLAVVALLVLGPDGLSGFVSPLRPPRPSGRGALALKGAIGATGVGAAAPRLLLRASVPATAVGARGSPRIV